MPPAQAPERAVGRTMVYETEDGERITGTLLAVNEDGSTRWRWSDGYETTIRSPFWEHMDWSGPEGSGTQTFSPASYFPMQVGDTIQATYTGQSSAESWTGERVCVVESQEQITVIAGTFDTYKIVCRSGSNVDSPARTLTFYYAPEVGDSVLFLHDIHYEDRSERRELVSVQDPAQ